MQVIIAGAGEIGRYIAEQVSIDGHDVTVIDHDEALINDLNSTLDVQAVCGSAASATTLLKAGIQNNPLVICVTGCDETNLVCATVAKKMGAPRVIAAVDEVTYKKSADFSYNEHFGIDELISSEMLTALELAALVRNPGSLAVEHFAQGKLEMQRFRANQEAKSVGRALGDIHLPDGVRICMIRRQDEFIIPTRHDQILHDDLVTIIGDTDQVMQARSDFEGKKLTKRKVIIMGGGHTAISLARRLRGNIFKLTIIEKDSDRCLELSNRLPAVTILNGDGTNLAFLEEERINNADIFIAATPSDEANIMSAIQAKNLGVQKTLVVIHRPDYAGLVEKIGVDRAVSPRVVMAKEILTFLRKGSISILAELGEIEILEMVVGGEEFVGKKLKDLKLPDESLVLTLLRDNDLVVPAAHTVFQLNDVVLIICKNTIHKQISKLVTGRS